MYTCVCKYVFVCTCTHLCVYWWVTRSNTCSTLQHVSTHGNTLQHTQHTATHRNTLQHTVKHCNTRIYPNNIGRERSQGRVRHANRLHDTQHTTIHCNTLQFTATHYNSLQLMQHTATQVGSVHAAELDMPIVVYDIQLTATHCNSLQLIAITGGERARSRARHANRRVLHATHYDSLQLTATHCNTLQYTFGACTQHSQTCQSSCITCNSLQLTATHCNTLRLTATQVGSVHAAEPDMPIVLYDMGLSRVQRAAILSWDSVELKRYVYT